ncbi:endospore germination permease [Radiobacillus sp. PE A8.2]|uniref:GerAB/ArcD/ProY family transporter n=1 Tax=Radiobacillus sp. PE A8.2 TaxID=3380349 RepID=UPI00388D219F
MDTEVKISGRQFTILVFMNVLGTAIIIGPSIATSFGKENGWISVFIATLIGIGIVLIYNQLFKINEKKDLFQLMEFVYGKWIGKVISLVFILLIFFVAAGNLRGMGDFIATQILVGTPMEVILLLTILTCLIGVRMGLEVLGRTSEIFFPYTFISLVMLLVFVIPGAEMKKIQPILQTNIADMFAGVIPLIGYPFLELIILLAIMKYVNRPENARKGFLVGVTLGGITLTIITFMCLVILGVDFTIRNTYPTYVLGKKISIADFLERIEIVVAIVWFFTIFFKITVTFYVLALGASRVLSLKSYKTLTIPLAYLLVVFAVVLAPNVIYYNQFLTSTWIPLSITVGLIIPLLTLSVGIIRKSRKN